MDAFNNFSIPFGKFIDPNTLGSLELIKSKEIEESLPIVDELYLIKDTTSEIYYCAFEPEQPNEPNYHGSIAGELIENFAKTELGDNIVIEMLQPKNEDWLVTHYLAQIHIEE